MKKELNIFVKDLWVYAMIGVAEQERKVGNEFLVNLSVVIDAENFQEEDLETSISYVSLNDIIKEEMSKEVMLLETVAHRIGQTILDQWANAKKVNIKIEKIKPPITGIQGGCGVEFNFTR